MYLLPRLTDWCLQALAARERTAALLAQDFEDQFKVCASAVPAAFVF